MIKKIKVDFYLVCMPYEAVDAGITFEGILKKVGCLDDEERNLEIRGFPIHMYAHSTWNQLWEVEMIRIRMNRLPIKASLAGEVEPITLNDDEGIGEETAFLFDPKTKTLVIQNNHMGVSASAVSKFFQEKSGLNTPISFLPIIKGDAVEQLQGLKDIQKMDISLASIDKIPSFKSNNDSISQTIDLANFFSAPTMNLTFSMGHHKGTLSINNVIKTAKEILGISNQNYNHVRKLEISGLDNSDEKSVFDLLEFKIFDEVKIQESNRRLSYKSRQEGIRKAWLRHKEEIENQKIT